MPSVTTEQDLVAACRETLRQWPQARAAVLFGSRARGTAHPDSDWDVAIVLEGDELRHARPARSVFPRPELPADLPQVDVWALSEEHLRRNARALGTLPYAVCRDGRVLAGEWSGPDPVQMEQEAAVNSDDWAWRMQLVIAKVHYALASLAAMAQSETWYGSGVDSTNLLQNSADAAELLVKAAIERRGVPADRSHDIAGLAARFATERPGQTALAQRMAALNGKSRPHHMAMYEFRLPEPSGVRTAVRRLGGTLDLWASEIETADDDMAAQLTGLARSAADRAGRWPDFVNVRTEPKTDVGNPAQAAAEAALDCQPVLAEAIASFRDRVQRALEVPAPGEDLPSPSPFD